METLSLSSLAAVGTTFFLSVLASYYLLIPFFTDRRLPSQMDDDAEGNELLVRYGRIAEQIADLENDFSTGKLEAADYRAVQGDLLHQLEEAQAALSAFEQGGKLGRRFRSGAL